MALTPAATDALQRHADRQREEGNYDPDGLVFTTTSGTPINVANLRVRSFKPLLRKAGLPDIPFHALRRTAATLMLGAGVHPKIAADMLGHASTQITLDVYSHATPGMHKQAAAAIGAALGGPEAHPPARAANMPLIAWSEPREPRVGIRRVSHRCYKQAAFVASAPA